MKIEYNINDYLKKIKKGNDYFHTFINHTNLAAGLLVLKPNETDTQLPHQNDEVYYVISGDGYLKIRDKDYQVSPDKIFFVAKNLKHHFHGNKKELRVLYFFGGADT